MTDAPQPTLLGEFLSNEEINILMENVSKTILITKSFHNYFNRFCCFKSTIFQKK